RREMRLSLGQDIEVSIEKPAAGGRMIARHEGQVVLVAGAIPGERVVARIERVEKRLAFAETGSILSPSPDRREPAGDPLCGGCGFAHIEYPRQVALKAQIIDDAFRRLGRIPLENAVPVAASPEAGYRMRARLHVRDGIAGFFREGTHQICDARGTRQLMPESIAAIEAALAALDAAGMEVTSIELSENVAGDLRALHAEIAGPQSELAAALTAAVSAARLTGLTVRTDAGAFHSAGHPRVTDPLALLTRGRASSGDLRRGPASFFQSNRFLIADLVVAVLDAMPSDGSVLDLYAGVGLFAVSLAASGRERVTAVEGDRISGVDLRENAAPYGSALSAIVGRVEDHLAGSGAAPETILLDPPRTGVSREAMDAIARRGARRIVYVSCDPATMARDARRLLDTGYRVTSLQGFDLFPNTPHVEVLGVFDA
ncbi:MAG: TRAM domain-containing protein, partial [Acidobacteriota bacterium]